MTKEFLATVRQQLGGARVARLVYRNLPSAKRCEECLVPFSGIFSIPFSFLQIRPSRKNPNLCTL
jgi:adenylate cyclase